jgi:hypothetical protein
MARKPRGQKSDAETTAVAHTSARALAGGRATTDREGQITGALQVVIPPPSPLDDWRTLTLDSRTLDRVTPQQLISYLLDLSPDISKGQWDFSRMANAGWEAKALRTGSDEIDELAQAALDAFLERLKLLYGSADVPINRLFMNALTRGGILSELVLDAAGRQPIDLAVPDAAIVRFRQVDDPERGTIYQAGQQKGFATFVPFDRETISYIPIDPAPGSPYGRPMIAPAIFAGLFILSMLHDLRRVIAQQGYPRPDISIDLEKLAVPAGIVVGTTAYYTWLGEIGQQIADAYAALEPDSAYVHTSATVLNRPVGTVDADSLGGLGQIIEAIERQLVRALKTAPFMMGMSQSQTETMANRQWEAFLQGIKSVQHLVEAQLERQCTLGLQAQGIVATVQWRFAENRAAEMERDERVKALKIANGREAYRAGFYSQDEASEYAVGKPADVPEPREDASGSEPPASDEVVEPGQNRTVPARRDRRAKLIPLGADRPFDPIPVPTPYTEEERAGLSDLWDGVHTGRNGKYKGILDAEIVEGEGDGE